MMGDEPNPEEVEAARQLTVEIVSPRTGVWFLIDGQVHASPRVNHDEAWADLRQELGRRLPTDFFGVARGEAEVLDKPRGGARYRIVTSRALAEDFAAMARVRRAFSLPFGEATAILVSDAHELR